MKNLIIALVILPTLSFGQNKAELETLPKQPKIFPTIAKVKQPTFIINDSLVDKKLTVKLNLDLINNIVIVKDDPNYPDGVIKITTNR